MPVHFRTIFAHFSQNFKIQQLSESLFLPPWSQSSAIALASFFCTVQQGKLPNLWLLLLFLYLTWPPWHWKSNAGKAGFVFTGLEYKIIIPIRCPGRLCHLKQGICPAGCFLISQMTLCTDSTILSSSVFLESRNKKGHCLTLGLPSTCPSPEKKNHVT